MNPSSFTPNSPPEGLHLPGPPIPVAPNTSAYETGFYGLLCGLFYRKKCRTASTAGVN
ncbi:hypothetical protein BDQ12DRAFT_679838 [Crucibulum laeve]|uniref:Uncharacterized protein n=1 Tax=Crucibulum laeve TaxID=68775 RepID=A0A5C3MHM9_9AGAR|nr:hypothetical protein BDQ12DRAFT_679838 [Crucibulum laeve]